MKQIKKMVKTILSDVEEFDVYQEVIEYSNDGVVLAKVEYSDEGELMSDQKNEYQDDKLISTKISHPLIFSEEAISYKYNSNGQQLEIVFQVNDEVDMIKRREYSEDNILSKELWEDADENIIRTIEFDTKGRVSKEISPEGYTTVYNYNEFDKFSGVRIFDGDDLKVEQTNEYNDRKLEIKSRGVNLDSNQELVVEKRYNENDLLVEELHHVDGYHEITKSYTYNEYNQLKHATEATISPSNEASVYLEYQIEYEYFEE